MEDDSFLFDIFEKGAAEFFIEFDFFSRADHERKRDVGCEFVRIENVDDFVFQFLRLFIDNNQNVEIGIPPEVSPNPGTEEDSPQNPLVGGELVGNFPKNPSFLLEHTGMLSHVVVVAQDYLR